MNMKIDIIHTDAILQLSEVSVIGTKSLKIILGRSLKSESFLPKRGLLTMGLKQL